MEPFITVHSKFLVHIIVHSKGTCYGNLSHQPEGVERLDQLSGHFYVLSSELLSQYTQAIMNKTAISRKMHCLL